jgi:hypothetical protein
VLERIFFADLPVGRQIFLQYVSLRYGGKSLERSENERKYCESPTDHSL